jgi:tRNA/rRNA methyltransferase
MSLENVRIVLVGTLYGGNIGSTCRAMRNMGLRDLAVVAPRSPDWDEARMMAVHATDILESRKECATLAEAVGDCGMVVGTTCRKGLYRQHARTPREWAPRLLEAARASKVALVFGREDNGLSNEELALCAHLVRIPAVDSYVSLNVSQAVVICCYELFVASGAYELPPEKSGEAPSDLRERMFAMWREALLEIGFMHPQKADHMMLGIRRVLARGAVTVDDVRILMGVARQSQWAARHGPPLGAPRPAAETGAAAVPDVTAEPSAAGQSPAGDQNAL